MPLQVEEYAYEMTAALEPLMGRIRRRDRSLAEQLNRSSASVALNIAEAAYSDPGNQQARFHTAAGSANETRAALRIATSRTYFAPEEATTALRLLDRILAILWRLTHP